MFEIFASFFRSDEPRRRVRYISPRRGRNFPSRIVELIELSKGFRKVTPSQESGNGNPQPANKTFPLKSNNKTSAKSFPQVQLKKNLRTFTFIRVLFNLDSRNHVQSHRTLLLVATCERVAILHPLVHSRSLFCALSENSVATAGFI